MTWVHMEFVLIFITGPSRAKLGRTAWQQLLMLTSLVLGWFLNLHDLYLVLIFGRNALIWLKIFVSAVFQFIAWNMQTTNTLTRIFPHWRMQWGLLYNNHYENPITKMWIAYVFEHCGQRMFEIEFIYFYHKIYLFRQKRLLFPHKCMTTLCRSNSYRGMNYFLSLF